MRSWIFMLAASLVLLGVYVYLKPRLSGEHDASSDEATSAPEESGNASAKSRKRKAKRERGSRRESPREPRSTRKEIVLGDILSEPDEEHEAPVEEREVFVPPPHVYQAEGAYRPTAAWSEPGADQGQVVTLDLGKKSAGAPLRDEQIEAVLDERKLMPCYERWVDKVPQMRGRVHMRFIVAPDGHVSSVRVERSKLRSREVEQCLVDRARRFRFPAASGKQSTRFSTHFDFTNH